MNLGGGAEKMQQEADKLGISINELAQSTRSLVASQAGATSSLANRGLRNPNKATSGNSDAVRLGEEIDRYLMGQSECDVYFITSTKAMARVNCGPWRSQHHTHWLPTESRVRDGYSDLPHALQRGGQWMTSSLLSYPATPTKTPSYSKNRC